MAMNINEIEAYIKELLPDAIIKINDLRGDGEHYSAYIASKEFAGKTRIQQHKMVYQALKGKMGGDLHALALQTVVIKD